MPSKEIKLYPCGTDVKLKLGDIEGMVTCNSIKFDKVQYEITFINNGTPHTTWVHEKEFSVKKKDTKKKIGFNS